MRNLVTVILLILSAPIVRAQNEEPFHSYAGVFSDFHGNGDSTLRYRGGIQYNPRFDIPSLKVHNAFFDGRVWIDGKKLFFFASLGKKYQLSDSSSLNIEAGKIVGPIFSKYVKNFLSPRAHDAFPSTSVQSSLGYGGKICYESEEFTSHLSYLYREGHYELSTLISFQEDDVEISIGASRVLYQKDWSLILSGFNPKVANVTISSGYRTDFEDEIGSSFFALNICKDIGERFSPYIDVLSQYNTSFLDIGCVYDLPVWEVNIRLVGYGLYEENKDFKKLTPGLRLHLYFDVDF